MKKKKNTENIQKQDNRIDIKSICICLLAFAIPFTIMGAAFAGLKVYPFGDKQVLAIDAWNQYYPFLVEFRRKIWAGESLLYCWHIGLGSGYVALIAYYLASPLNLLFVLFPESLLREAFALMILIKIGLAGCFSAFSLNKLNQKKDYSAVIFSTLYALCSWVLGYYWNIMWLDAFALFPLIVLGISVLVQEKKYKLYTVSLAAAIFVQYYIGLMICIFTVLYFFAQCVLNKNRMKELFHNLRNIILFSSISIMMSAVVTLPTLITLRDAFHKTDQPTSWQVLRGWMETLANSAAYIEVTAKEGLPNIYCGVICIVFLFVFYKLSKISVREKAVCTLLILIFYVSININMLDYVWHGFHVPNMMPYRYTFMFSFLLVMLAYKAYSSLDNLKVSDYRGVCIACAVYFLLIAAQKIISGANSDTEDMGSDEIWAVLIKNLLLIIVYLGILILFVWKKINKTAFAIILAVAVGLELVPFTFASTEIVTVTNRDGYPDKNNEVQKILGDLADREEENDFSRIEFTKRYSRNPSALYGYNGLATFSSTASAAVWKACEDMGFSAQSKGLWYYYQNSTPVNNAFLNIKYLISRRLEVTNQEYLAKIEEVQGVYAYENLAYLPIGFMVESEMADFEFGEVTPFEKQNKMLQAATGITEDVFEPLDVAYASHQNVNVTKWDYGSYSYEPTQDADESDEEFVFSYKMPADGSAYVYVNMNTFAALNTSIEFNNYLQSYELHRPNIFPAGTFKKGDIFTVKTSQEAGKAGDMNIYVGVLNHEVFDQAYDLLKDEGLRLTASTSRSLEGKITAQKDGLMYTSVPYETGWKVYIDGEETDHTLVMGAFIGVMLSAGEHTVEIKYVPMHVYLAGLISLVGVAVFLLICWADKKKNLLVGNNVRKRVSTKSARKKQHAFFMIIMIALFFCYSIQAEASETDQPIADGMYKVVSAIDNEYVWDIDNAATNDGANLQLWRDNDTNAQKFTFTYDADGYYTITNINSGKAIGCSEDDFTDNVNMQQSALKQADTQRWKLIKSENGYYTLTCKSNNMAADVSGGVAENGTNMQMYQSNQTAAQEFKLVETTRSEITSNNSGSSMPKIVMYIITFLLLGMESIVIIGAGYLWERFANSKKKSLGSDT